jgi:hypothetical protein
MAKKDELEFEGGIENAPKPNNSEKLKALQAAMDKIEKSFGKGSIMKMGDDHVQEVEVIPTGSIALNAALGVGGYPKGRIIEIYGPESSGKTTLAIHAIAQRFTDKLDRGLVAVKTTKGVYCSWRIQADEYYDVKYNLYRDGTRVNAEPLDVSNFTDASGSEAAVKAAGKMHTVGRDYVMQAGDIVEFRFNVKK